MWDRVFASSYDSGRAIEKGSRLPWMVRGIIKENWNQDHPGLVRVEYELGESGKMVSNWAEVLTPYSAPDGGIYFLPEVGSSVAVDFINGSPNCPVVVGSMWSSSAARPADGPDQKNINKIIRTKSGTGICISDEENKEAISIVTRSGLCIQVSDEKKTISIQDKDGKNMILLDTEKGSMKLNADKEMTLCVGGKPAVTIKANEMEVKSGAVTVNASQKLDVTGQTTNVKGSQIQMKADASMKAGSGGILELTGNMVKVN